MTAPEAARAAQNYMMPLVLGLLAIGIAVNFALLIPALNTQGDQARAGQKARNTQCQREPVIRKLILAGAHYRLLAPDDVRTFRRTAPRGCPQSP